MPSKCESLAAARKCFDRDGFVAMRGFLSQTEVDELQREIDRYIARLPELPSQDSFFEDRNDPMSLFRLDGMHRHDVYFRDITANARYARVAEALLGEPIDSRGSQMFGKAPRIGNETPAHQDAYYWKIEPPYGLTMWIALDKSDRENGCVCYVPGSHRGGFRPHGKSAVFGFSQGLLEYTDEDRATEVAIEAERGDLTVHHGMTVHRADANPSDRRRWALGLVYFAAQCRRADHPQIDPDGDAKAQWKAAGRL